MVDVRLVGGDVATIDEEDSVRVLSHSWYHVKPDGRKSYVMTTIKDKTGRWVTVYMHRFVLNAPKGVEVDHVNGDGLDNRRENLRLATRQENCRNMRKRSGCSSRYRGVSFSRRAGRWEAYIHRDRVKERIGMFENEVDAAHAYDVRARELFGDFSRLNFPSEDERAA